MGIPRGLIFLVISIIVSAIAVIAGVQWSNRQIEKQAASVVRLVVASVDLAPGTRLTPELLKAVEWPAASPMPGSFTDPSQLVDRVTYNQIWQGEAVIEKKLAPVGSKAGLAAVIPVGQRAITVRVNDVIGVAGFALPGNFVDVLVNVQDEKAQSVSKIVLQKILVLAVAQDQQVKDDTHAKVVNAVTLQVTPEQAEKLDLARSVGALSLALRNQIDQTPIVTAGVRKPEILAMEGPLPNASKKPVPRVIQVRSVEILRGTSRSTMSLH